MLNNRVGNYRRGLTLRLSTVVSVLACVALLGTASLLCAQPTSSPVAWAFGTAAGTETLTITPSAALTATPTVLTQGATGLDFTSAGGTCARGSASSCTVNVKFAPTTNGLRFGAVVLTDSNGTTAVPLSGVGTGAAAIFVPGTISTLAGVQYLTPDSAECIENGDNGAATAAHFCGPNSFAFDGSGNLYIADWQNAVVRKVSTKGTISLFAGIPAGSGKSLCTTTGTGGTPDAYGDGCVATQATLSYPEAVMVDGAGNLYITDSGDNMVRVVNAKTSVISIFAGTPSPSSGCKPASPATQSTVPYTGDGDAATSAVMCYPNALAEDTNGNIYISDYFNNMIHVVTPSTGIINTVVGNSTVSALAPPSCATAGTITVGDGCLANATFLTEPQDITFDGAGNLYIADYLDNAIRKVTGESVTSSGAVTIGTITSIAGSQSTNHTGDGGPATAATIDGPFGVRVDGAGNVYFSENYGNTIREISTSGIISTVAGEFVQSSGVSGLGVTGYTGDGGPATSAQLNAPTRIAVDGVGNIWIADYGNNVVRAVNVSGVNVTVNKVVTPNTVTVPAFASTSVGAASTAQDVTLMNNGTSPLSLTVPVGVPTDFNLNGTGNTCIASAFPLAAGGTCVFAIEFEPTVSGSIAENLLLTDNSVTGATQDIALSGTSIAETQTITFANPGTQVYGGTLTLNATASSGLAVSYSITAGSSIASLSGDVLSFSGTGSVTVQATQAGNGSYAAATPVSQQFSVGTETQTITFANPGTQTYGSGAITLNATASSGLTITYTVTTGNSIASVSGSSLTLTGAGSVTIQASQPGNTNIAAATPVSQTFNVVEAAYTLPSPSAVAAVSIASAGGSGTTTFSVTSQNYAGTINFTTNVSTTNGTAGDVTASASPVTLTAGGTGTSTLTITTTSGAANHAPKLPWKGAGALMACAVLLGAPFSLRRKRTMAVVLTGLAISLVGFMMACSSGGSSTPTPTPTQAARTYTVTVTPAGTGTVANPAALTVTVTVQ